jgi:hypothetical protein
MFIVSFLLPRGYDPGNGFSMSHSRRFVPLLQRRLADTCDYSLRPENFFAGSSSRLSLLKNVSGLQLGSPIRD